MDVKVNEVNRISGGSYFKGDLFTDTDLRIDGVFCGDIVSSARVVIGENAKVEGEIICANLDIYGKQTGDVYVKDVVSLKANSEVRGDVYLNRFQVEIGADIIGHCLKCSEEEFNKKLESLKPNI